MQDIAPRPDPDRIADAVSRLQARHIDVLFFNGPIDRPCDDRVIHLCRGRRDRTAVLLLLITDGGDADAAYRISRCLQETYQRVTLFVSGCCKSAGTLIATGAHEIVMGPHGELGPLDVQMRKTDELWEMSSGLTIMEALNNLQERAFAAFENSFLMLKARSGGQITTRTAMDAAVALTTGLFQPLYAQVDPLHVGEAYRALNVAEQYAARLGTKSQNLRPDAIEKLTASFASHSFAIDASHAKEFFFHVRPPDDDEADLADALGIGSRLPGIGQDPEEGPQIHFLTMPPGPPDGGGEEDDDAKGDQRGGPGEDPGPTGGDDAAADPDSVTSLEQVRADRKV